MKRALLLFLLFIILTGCGNLSKANYDKLKVGMTYDEVVAILGKPDDCSEALFARNCTWGNESKHITVSFIGDKVMLYASKNVK